MRILLVNTRHYPGGGDSNYTLNLADLLRSQGHLVFFFAMHTAGNLPDPNADLFVSEIDYRELNRQKSPATALKVLARSIYSREARQKFAQLLDRVQPDLIHLQNLHAHLTPSIIFEAKQRGLPVVWTLHDYKLICPNSHFRLDQTGEICEACRGGRFYQALLKGCKKGSRLASGMASLEAYVHTWLRVREQVDSYLCPSAFLRGKLLENGFPADQTLHLPLFLPEPAFACQTEADGYLLFLGKLEALKGLETLLAAARLAPGVKLILAGRAEAAVARQLAGGLPPNVEYVGFQTGQALEILRRRACALVLPSHWYENQPLSLLEAFALGKPVIATNLGGMRELVGENERGWLVPPGDAQALAEAMQWMASHPCEAGELGRQAFDYARQFHSAQSHLVGLGQIYEQAISASSKRAGSSLKVEKGDSRWI